jgi:hypothetical protein
VLFAIPSIEQDVAPALTAPATDITPEATPLDEAIVAGVYWNDSNCDLCFIIKARIGANSDLVIIGNKIVNANLCPSICLACRLPEDVVETIVFCCDLIETAFAVGVEGKVPLIILN